MNKKDKYIYENTQTQNMNCCMSFTEPPHSKKINLLKKKPPKKLLVTLADPTIEPESKKIVVEWHNEPEVKI